jgi:hypothetical protein
MTRIRNQASASAPELSRVIRNHQSSVRLARNFMIVPSVKNDDRNGNNPELRYCIMRLLLRPDNRICITRLG